MRISSQSAAKNHQPLVSVEPLEARVFLSASGDAATLAVGHSLRRVIRNDSPTTGQFGDINGQHGVTLTLDNAQGVAVTFSLSSGTGTATLGANGFDVTLSNTTAHSTFAMGGGAAIVDSFVDAGSLKSISAAQTNLAGALSVGGTLGRLTLNDVNGPSQISISGSARPTDIRLKNVSQLSIDSASPIASLTASNWDEPGTTRGQIDVPWIGSFHVAGNFAANVNLTSSTHGKSLQNFVVQGALEAVQIRAAVSIQRLIVGAINNSLVFAGVQSGLSTLPQGADDFSASAKIGVLKATGIAGQMFAVTASNIAASRIGTLSLAAISGSNNGVSFGVAALSVGSYRRGPTHVEVPKPPKPIRLRQLTTPGIDDQKQDYLLTIV